jgi:hypothetical protein
MDFSEGYWVTPLMILKRCGDLELLLHRAASVLSTRGAEASQLVAKSGKAAKSSTWSPGLAVAESRCRRAS